MPERVTIAMEGVGALLVVLGVASWSLAAAAIVAGVALIAGGWMASQPTRNRPA